jgi:hypothetical protein
MTRDPVTTRRRRKVVFGVLAVGIIMSAVVAIILVYLGQVNPRF